MNRIHNFSAGPAILPIPVVKATLKAVEEYNGNGMSIMEMSHRSKPIVAVFEETNANVLSLMNLSADDYAVLFLGGGASMQFAMVAYNFLKGTADYINTGTWSTNAIKEAKKLGNVNVAASSEDTNFNYIPKTYKLSENADYLHYTSNNTIFGTEFKHIPQTNASLICDMSSDLFARELDFSKFDLIYAGAQKNIGPAGATMVVIKKSMLEKANSNLLTMLSYKTHVEKESMFNTPPVLPVFVVGETLKWIKNEGGIKAIEQRNIHKAGLIYDVVDSNSSFYKGSVINPEDRSLMNLTFNLPSEELEEKFIKEAKAKNLDGLKGHRSVGGVRASIYNACPVESCQALADFMKEFYVNNK